MTPEVVGGRFRLGRLLGAGGTASVYEAEDLDGEPVAVKLLHPQFAKNPAIRDAFFEEVAAAQAIHHPGIAQIREWGVDESDAPIVWIAMDLVRGRTLAAVVADRGGLTPSDAVAVGAGLLSTLAAAHRGGVVHRDVSPANVMIDPHALDGSMEELSRSVRLLDFGLADIPGRTTSGSDPLLSGFGGGIGVRRERPLRLPRASPRQARHRVKRRVPGRMRDLLRAHRSRSFRRDRDAIVLAHIEQTPPRASELCEGVPGGLDQWLAISLRKSPAARFADATAMLHRMPVGILPSAVGLPGAPMPAPGARVPDERTRLLPLAEPPRPLLDLPARPSRPRGSGWLVAAVGGAAIVGVIGIAAIAGGAPTAAPSAAPPTMTAPTPTASASLSPSPTATTVDLRTVPDLADLSLTEAVARLQAEGLVVGRSPASTSRARPTLCSRVRRRRGAVCPAARASRCGLRPGVTSCPWSRDAPPRRPPLSWQPRGSVPWSARSPRLPPRESSC